MANLLRKYRKTAAMEASSLVGESSLFLVEYLLRLLRVLVMLSLWRTILTGKGAVSGLTLASVLTYTLISEAFGEVLACRTNLFGSFWDGTIATRYLRPLDIFGQFAAETFGQWIFGGLAFSLPLLLCAPLLGVHPLPANVVAGGLFLVSLTLAIVVGLAMDFLFAGLAVGLGAPPYAMERVRMALGTLLSGAFVPLALLPWGIGNALALLPFAAMASAPLQLYVGAGNAPVLLALQAGWAVVLWPLARWVWHVNRERMVSYGG